MISKIAVLILLMSSISANAAMTCVEEAEPMALAGAMAAVTDRMSGSCPSNDRIRSLCGFVDSQTTEGPGSENYYTYQTKIYTLACVNSADDESTIRRKVQEFWRTYSSEMTCNSPNFNVPNGSLLKLAVYRNFDDFVNEAVSGWAVNLNTIDQSDQRTVLDYIQDEMTKTRGTALESKMQRYYNTFRSAGAKHRREL